MQFNIIFSSLIDLCIYQEILSTRREPCCLTINTIPPGINLHPESTFISATTYSMLPTFVNVFMSGVFEIIINVQPCFQLMWSTNHYNNEVNTICRSYIWLGFFSRIAWLRSQILLSNQSNMGKAVGYGKKPSDMANPTAIAIKAK